MFEGKSVATTLSECGVTHVVWIPDSVMGLWEKAFDDEERLSLIRACREGEGLAIAAGLHIGGKSPVVIIQCTGFFEAGDSFRNYVHDLHLPLFFIIGYRNYYAFQEGSSRDSATRYIESILRSWEISYTLLKKGDDVRMLASLYTDCIKSNRAAAVLLAE